MSYDPDSIAVALQQSQRFVRTLSLREVSLVIPVNFVTYAGVALTAACFGHNQYEEFAAANCFSNLLAIGFRRFDADVYWDASRTHWSLCPVELAGDGTGQEALTSSTSVPNTSSRTASQLGTNFITGRSEPSNARNAILQRQTESNASPTQSSNDRATTVSPDSAGQTAITAAVPTSTDTAISNNDTVQQIGPYSCSTGTDLAFLVSVLNGYLQNTGYRLNATTITLTLNLHAAAPASDPIGSALRPSDDRMPSAQSLSDVVTPILAGSLYTPEMLVRQRSDLNTSKSWFTVQQGAQPDPAFFHIDVDADRDSTPDGWPSESYVELSENQRVLVAFGAVDPQLDDYDTASDGAYIFPGSYLASPQKVTTTSTGNITSGCLFNPNDTGVASQNSSWAISTIGNGTIATADAIPSIMAQATNLTSCGITPILNITLNNITADIDSDLYTAFVQSTVWSWAATEPANASSSESLEDYHCAALNSTSGGWQALDCGQSRRGACRVGDEPYIWSISNDATPYDRVDLACDDGTTFDTPRNSLENAHLLYTWRSWQVDHRGDDDDSAPMLWLNFNDLDLTSCWVIGQNSTCPYEEDTRDQDSREIIVPVVGGIVVFALAALTILVKCAGNRQQSKQRRRRGDDGWDYEGVPS